VSQPPPFVSKYASVSSLVFAKGHADDELRALIPSVVGAVVRTR
jgi:hypothetical protein